MSYIILASSDLINFANGQSYYGRQIGSINNAGTSAATYNNEVTALNHVITQGYALAFVKGWASGKEFFFTY